MAKKSKSKKKKSSLQPETKNSIAGTLLIGLSLILALAALGKAGPVGKFLYTLLEKLFGLGYYLLPLIAFAVGILFILSRHQEALLGRSLIGAVVFIISGLGFMDLLFPLRGGFVGQGIGALETPFGFPASIVLTLVLMIISLLVTFDTAITIKNLRLAGLGINKKEKTKSVELEDSEATLAVSSGEDDKEEEEEIDEEEFEDNEEPEDEEVNVAEFSISPGKKTRRQKIATSAKYVAPPLSLLKSAIDKPTSGDLRANANIIKRTLDSFGITVEMGEINIGPKVTRYTLKPAEGVKLSRIIALNQDLALSLAAHPIRIEAPIPGKSLVGIEVPNRAAALVRLGSLLSYQDFSSAGPLSVIMGRDVTGELMLANLEKMPHLLVAGATGSGKSIFLHSVLISLLYKNSPEVMKLILIDPKRVELSTYQDIPHLVSPVITEGKKTIGVFRWAISEMDRRYEELLSVGARDIQSYNKKATANGTIPLPFLVIVVDELADLMAVHGREIESSIVRLAQMARATGIHLIVATQRPSVEVITGLIKANITARVALQVASQIDSRTILDMAGAEKLLGGGDMLFISADYSKPKRIQAPYISEEEVQKVTDFIRDNNESEEDEEDFEEENGKKPLSDYLDGPNDDEDDLLSDAIEVVKSAQKASASLLQRRLKVGYARAARLLDIMEDRGLVGPGEGAKPREVYMDNDNEGEL
jgi:DNA segregation ATPase FtsK/SpoIIIE, S-DNA-T family